MGVSERWLAGGSLSADTADTQGWAPFLSTDIIKPSVWEAAAERFALRLISFPQILLGTPDSVKT